MTTVHSPLVSPLRAAGYAVLPTPRETRLTGGTVQVHADWRLAHRAVDADDIAVRTLQSRLEEEHGFRLTGPANVNSPTVELAIDPQSVETDTDDDRQTQAYTLDIGPNRIVATGVGPAGLFYAVQTLLHLFDSGQGRLPQGRIRDWPRLAWRCIHWDTKHHQDTLETLRRYLDQAARYKINAVLFELEDKFAYPSHPVIGAPGAFTPAELQSLTDYALERHIQIIPDVQSPAHLCYVLKHETFSALRCDGSNYQICMDDPAARQLLFDMYDDLCDATRGAKFFHVSTDEVYYAGICEKYRRPYNPENRSLTLIDFIGAAHERLTRRNREMLIWLEYPLLPEHIDKLPARVINGVASRDPDQIRAERRHGIRRFVYWPTQGSELVFPRYFAFDPADGARNAGRLSAARDTFFDPALTDEAPMGAIAAAWDDAGLHNESFWLGWAHMAQHAWTPTAVSVEETTATFMDIHYGRGTAESMAAAYRTLHNAARLYEQTLEKLPSKVRGPAYGHPLWKGPMPRCDTGMMPPAEPRLPNDTAVSMPPVFGKRYAEAVARAPAAQDDCERLIEQLHGLLGRAQRNRYAIEVLISLTTHLRHFFRIVADVAKAEDSLRQAALAGKQGEHRQARRALIRARDTVRDTLRDGQAVFEGLRAVWERSQRPRNAPADGKFFVHVMDDVKDHFADRRADLTYLIAPEETLNLGDWLTQIDETIQRYDAATNRE